MAIITVGAFPIAEPYVSFCILQNGPGPIFPVQLKIGDGLTIVSKYPFVDPPAKPNITQTVFQHILHIVVAAQKATDPLIDRKVGKGFSIIDKDPINGGKPQFATPCL